MNNNKNNECELLDIKNICLPLPYIESPNLSELKSKVTALNNYADLVLSNYHTFHEGLAWSMYGEVEQLNLELSNLVKSLNTIVKKLQRGDQG